MQAPQNLLRDPQLRLPGGEIERYGRVMATRASRSHFLSKWHEERGAAVTCMCTEPGIDVGVACRKQPFVTFYLYHLHAGDGQKHHRDCPLHVDLVPPGQEGAGGENEEIEKPLTPVGEEGAVIFDRDNVFVRFEGPISYVAGKPIQGEPSGVTKPPQPVRGELQRASAQTLLEVLWTHAELNIWRPGFEGKRSYNTARNRLLGAAARLYVTKQLQLAELLYIPPPFFDEKREQIETEFNDFLKRINPDRRQAHRGFMAGFIRNLKDPAAAGGDSKKARQDLQIYFAHHKRPVLVPHKLWDRLTEAFPAESMETFEPDSQWGRFYTLFHVELASKEGPIRAINGAILQLTKQWLPVHSLASKSIVESLVGAKRRFRCNFAWLDPEPEFAPDVVLEDTAPETAVEVLEAMNDPLYVQAWGKRLGHYMGTRTPVWYWDATQGLDTPMPPLPAVNLEESTDAHANAG